MPPFKKNAEANDRAYDVNQKTVPASDALVKEYSAFQASMKKVTSGGRRCVTCKQHQR